MADAKRHALRRASTMGEVEQIAADYSKTIFEPTKRFLLGEGEYYDLMKGIVESLPAGSDKRISYPELIRRRFGFLGNPTREDILADETEMTVEEVRSLERKALSIMRHPSRSTEVKKYLEARRWEFMAHLFQTGYLH